MSVTQFAMVEELAFLVKDNLRSKHLVLSMEETLVNFLLQEDDNLRSLHKSLPIDLGDSSDAILELEPMDPYNRLLLHRLADIFGFAHVSVGEGDDRHLILQRCAETSIPSILVSDILFQYDEPHSSSTSNQLLRRDSPPVLKTKLPSIHTLKEREAAYLAARERIFSVDVGDMREPVKQKPRNVPLVARRMIAHALGQKMSPTQEASEEKDTVGETHYLGSSEGAIFLRGKSLDEFNDTKRDHNKLNASSNSWKNLPKEPADCTRIVSSQNGAIKNNPKEFSKEQHLGAAKRMFANALGLHSAKGGFPRRLNKEKQVDME